MSQNEGEVEAQQEVDAAEAEVETLDESSAEEKDTTDWKAKFDEAEGRRKRAEKQLEKSKIDKKVEKFVQKQTDELDETQLDYLDLKGVSAPEDVKLIEDIVKKTGQSVRDALKDDYVVSKLASNKAARDVKDATPSSTKRGAGAGGNDLATALAKYTQSGYSPEALPTDFKLRIAVVNAVSQQTQSNKPAWH